MRLWLSSRGCFVAVLFLLFSTARAQEETQFPYVNAEGQIQRAQAATQAPEPYRSAYAMRRRVDARSGQRQQDPASDAQDEAARVERQRAQWVARMILAREQLLSNLGALLRTDQALGEAKQNPLLAVTPDGRARIQRAQTAYDAALMRVRFSERLLAVSLPEEARQAQIPPLWLEP